MSKKIFVGIGILALIAVVSLNVLSAEYSKADFVQMLENTDQCLADCYTVYKVCNPTSQDYSVSDSSKFYVDFIGQTNSLTGYYFQKKYNYNVTHIDAVCEEVKCVQLEKSAVDDFGILQTEKCTCTSTSVIESQETKTSYRTFIPTAEIIKAGQCHTIKVKGNKIGKLGSNNVDNILNYADLTFDEYAWWNSSWNYSMPFVISPNETLSNFPFALELNTSTLVSNGKLAPDCSDLRVVNDDNTSEYNFDVENSTCNSNETIVWTAISSTAGLQKTGYLFYFNEYAPSVSNDPSPWDNDYVLVLHFGENSTAIKDSSSANRGGTKNGATFVNEGVFGSALSFDGINDYINISDFYVNKVTIEAWFKITSLGVDRMIVSKDTLNNREYQFGPQDDNMLYWYVWNNTEGYKGTVTEVLEANKWYYAAGVYNGTNVLLYLDGVLVDSNNLTGDIDNGGSALNIGRWTYQSDRYFPGIIDEVRISNVSRSAEWINQTYHSRFKKFGEEQGISPTTINLMETLDPSSTFTDNNVSVFGSINLSDGTIAANNAIEIFLNSILLNDNNLVTDNVHSPAWWNYSFANRLALDFDIDAGKNHSNNVSIPINFSTTSLINSNKINDNCSDISITNNAGDVLDFELERGSCNSPSTVFWITPNSIIAGNNNTFYAYYGNDDVYGDENDTSSGSVWNNDYVLIYHFGENITDAKGIKDNMQGNDGFNGGAEYVKEGIFGNAYLFDGSSTAINMTNSSMCRTVPFTAETWAKLDSLHRGGVIATADTHIPNEGYAIFYDSGNSYYTFRLYDDSVISREINSGTINDLGWHYLSLTYDASLMIAYVDGEQVGNMSVSASSAGKGNFTVGREYTSLLDFFFNGTIDEVRISNITRSKEYIKATYQSMKKHYQDEESVLKTDSSGNYNYTFTSPSYEGTFPIRVNTTFLGIYGKAEQNLTTEGGVAPVINFVEIYPLTAYYNNTLNCSFNITDGNSETVRVNITWFNGSNPIDTFDFYFANITQGQIYNGSAYVPNGTIRKSETWTCGIFALDDSGNSKATNTSITVSNSAPGTPTITNPSDYETINTISVNLDWDGASDKDGDSLTYIVNLSSNNSGIISTVVYEQFSDTNYTYNGLNETLEYIFRVVANDAETLGSWTADVHFNYSENASEYADETEGRAAILAGIYNSSASTAIIYTSQQIYARNLTNGQILGTFDHVAVYLNQTWAFNYITGSDTYVNMFNLTPVLYTLEMTNKTEAQIRSEVEIFINSTIN